MRKQLLILISGVLLIIANSCNTFSKKNGEQANCKLFLILFDLSQSVKNPALINGFKSDFKTIIQKVKPGDVIVAGFITETSISEHSLPINFRLPVYVSTTDNDLYAKAEASGFQNRITTVKDSLVKVTDSLFKITRKVLQTDIFSSLLLAEKIFNSYPDNEKILIVMSDMIECSSKINFDHEVLNDKRIREIIETRAKINELPNLQGVRVYITGANAETPERFNDIQNFWINYFQTCKAKMDKTNYGPTLITFNE